MYFVEAIERVLGNSRGRNFGKDVIVVSPEVHDLGVALLEHLQDDPDEVGVGLRPLAVALELPAVDDVPIQDQLLAAHDGEGKWFTSATFESTVPRCMSDRTTVRARSFFTGTGGANPAASAVRKEGRRVAQLAGTTRRRLRVWTPTSTHAPAMWVSPSVWMRPAAGRSMRNLEARRRRTRLLRSIEPEKSTAPRDRRAEMGPSRAARRPWSEEAVVHPRAGGDAGVVAVLVGIRDGNEEGVDRLALVPGRNVAGERRAAEEGGEGRPGIGQEAPALPAC